MSSTPIRRVAPRAAGPSGDRRSRPVSEQAGKEPPIGSVCAVMVVRYNPAFSVLMIVAGVFVGGTGILVGKLMLMGLGALHLLIGIGYSVQPWFVVHESSTEIKNLLGMTMKTVPAGLAGLELRDGKLQPKDGGKPKLGGFMARQGDIDAIAAKLR